MITAYELIYQAASNADPIVREAHYHLASRHVSCNPDILEEASFHLVNRAITMNQIGYDHYYNIVTYRV